MDVIMQRLANESHGKFALVSGASKNAFDALLAQQGNCAYETHQLREKCLTAIELALDSKSPRLVRLATDALQFIIRDNQLHSLRDAVESEDETLPVQIINTLHDLPSWSQDSDLQCHCFTILLQLTSNSAWTIDSNTICKILQLCISTFSATEQLGTRMAARATVIQTINSFCTNFFKDDSDVKHFQEITNLMSYCCDTLKMIMSSPSECPPLLLMLDAVHAVLTSHDERVPLKDEFLELIWQQFIPIVINILGDPTHMNLTSSTITTDVDRGRGAGSISGDQVIFGAPEVAKSAYRICGELLRLLGGVASMRSVLEALFHRFLLFPPTSKRLEALKTLKTILENPRRVLDFGVNFSKTGASSNTRSDLTLWQIVLDCLVDCTMQSNVEISTLAVRCTTAFIFSVSELVEENSNFLPDEYVVELNKRFASVTEADFDSIDYTAVRERFDSVKNEEDIQEERSKKNEESEDCECRKKVENSGEDNFDDSMKSIAGRIGETLRRTDESSEDGVFAYLDRIRSTWRKSLKHDPSHVLQRGTSFDRRESASALEFVDEFINALSTWNSIMSTIELDVAVQTFAAEIAEKFMLKQLLLLQEHGSMYEAAIYNADALYLLTFACLDVAYSLNTEKSISELTSVTKFAEAVTNTGSIAYVSLSFIESVFNLLNEKDIFLLAKIKLPSVVIKDLIKDYNGRDGQLLGDYVRLERTTKRRSLTLQNVAALKIARRLVSSSWSGIVEILSFVVDRANASSILPSLLLRGGGGVRTNLSKNQRMAEAVHASLEGLHRLSTLCPKLELKNKSGWIFRKLVEASCPLEELRRLVKTEQERQSGISSKLSSLGRSVSCEIQTPHALSMQVILDNAIQVGSADAECWNPVVRCIEYVCELEHYQFTCISSRRSFLSSNNPNRANAAALTKFDVDDDDFVTTMPLSPVRNCENIIDAIEEVDGPVTSGKFLSEKATTRVLCILCAKIDRFFEDSSRCLNMNALKEFVKCLIAASQSNLFYGASTSLGRLSPWTLLERMSTILNRIARSGRPLVHLMTVWGLVAPHFIEAACSNDAEISCKTVDFLRESIAALLESGANFHNFHFNESLFQPFQTILCLELCGEETFDRVVCAIAELVESYKKEIYTGWKSLFGALRAVRCSYMFSKQQMSADDLKHLHTAVVDVFSCFLKADNLKLFCRASSECISCLLRFLIEDDPEIEKIFIKTDLYEDDSMELVAPNPDFAKTSLCFLRQCHSLLILLYEWPNDEVVVHLLRRLTTKDHSVQMVDGDLPCLDSLAVADVLPSLGTFLSDQQQNLFGWNFSPFFLEQRMEEPSIPAPWSDFAVNKKLVCEAWVDLIEGLVGSIATCPRYLQPEVIDVVFTIVASMLEVPGLTFGAYCLNHLVLPMLQRWIRREESSNDMIWRENNAVVRNFKQCVGLTVDTVVKYVETDPDAPCNRLLLSQTFDLLTEFVSTPSEVVARLGCSSVRHVINCLKNRLTSKSWDVVCRCMWRMGSVTLQPLRFLMSYFAVGSHKYAGDLGTVQVAVRKDTNPSEAARFRALAQQVFLVDSQKYEENLEDHPDKLSQSYRSIVFLLNPSNATSNDYVIRLPFRNIVFGLLSHQLWLQLIGTLLSEGSRIKLTALSSTLTRHVYSTDSSTQTSEKLTGCLEFFSNEQLCCFLLCLDASFAVAVEFDRRPGLKFLLQKVFSSPVSTNLYKQAVTCWTFKALTLYQLATSAVFDVKSTLNVKRIKDLADDENVVDCADLDGEMLAKQCGVFYLRLICRAYFNVCRTFCDVEASLSGGLSHADRLAVHSLDVVLPTTEPRKPKIDEEINRKAATPSPIAGTEDSSSSGPPSSGGAGSLRSSPVKEQRSSAATPTEVDEGEKIYTLASTDVVQDFLKDYKRHKMRNVLITKKNDQRNNGDSGRKNPFDDQKSMKGPFVMNDADSEEFGEDRMLRKEVVDSLMKDGEAASLAWSEMSISLLQLVLTLPDDERFRSMLPTVYQAATLMTSRSSNPRVKLLCTDLLYRLADVFHFFE